MGRLLCTLLGVLILTGIACAQRFDLPAGESVGKKAGASTVTTIVESGSHHMIFREVPASGAPVQVGGEYRVSSNMGGEIHAKLTVDSLIVGGGNATSAKALGLKLKLGSVVMFTMRLQSGGSWSLTVFDADIQPVLSREMHASK